MHSGHSSYFHFDKTSLSVVAGGGSTLDQSKLAIYNLDDADSFIRSYGFNYANEDDAKKLWYFHRRALVLMTEKLKFKYEEIPDEVKIPEQLKDLRQLLIWASSHDNANIQKWACAFLRCIHVFIHAETDLFSYFAEEIQKQILVPFENTVIQEDKLYLRSFVKDGPHQVELLHFQSKPFKTSTSTVIKLLAKPDALAVKVYDKIGVRFITKTIFDSFQVIRFLVDSNLISYPHIMPDQSSNNMYPVEEFLNICERLEKKHGPMGRMEPQKVDRLLSQQLKSSQNPFIKLFRKENPYSSIDFRYIKFISRKLIKINPQSGSQSNLSSGTSSAQFKDFSFFYPFEVQIMDQAAYQKMQTGDSGHNEYKNRQIIAARKRVIDL